MSLRRSTKTLINSGGALEKFKCSSKGRHKGDHQAPGFDLKGTPIKLFREAYVH